MVRVTSWVPNLLSIGVLSSCVVGSTNPIKRSYREPGIIIVHRKPYFAFKSKRDVLYTPFVSSFRADLDVLFTWDEKRIRSLSARFDDLTEVVRK